MSVVNLDASQVAAVSIDPGDRQLVFAGPGAGKSEVVGALAGHLIDIDNAEWIYPEEILIISFSRAAVDVVRRRTSNVTDKGVGVDVATLDSLAARLLADHSETEHRFTSYENSIKDARRLLTQSDAPLLDNIRHVIIDEVQDIVGVRAEFALALLTRGVPEDAGFTLLGDPLQALYDFQLDQTSDVTSEDFLNKIRMRWAPTEHHLTGEYRSKSDDARKVSDARASLLPMQAKQRIPRLRQLAAELPPLGDLDADSAADIAAWEGSTALLCDTNARAGLATDVLAQHGCRSHLAASALDPGIPGWIASVLGRRSTGALDRAEFEERSSSVGLDAPDELWWGLVELAPGVKGIDIDLLIRRLSDSREATRLARPAPTTIVGSTVHRAKGLEFDNVVLVDPDDWEREDGRPEDLASMLYVALSRGRQRVTIVTGVPTRGWSRFRRSRLQPWVCRAFRGRGYSKLIMEPSYARALGPVEHDLGAHIGAELRWHRAEDHITVEDEAVPSWIATVGGEDVARTGIELGRIVGRLRHDRWGRYPNLVGGRVEGVETLVNPDASDDRRVWLSARIACAVQLDWKES